MSIYAITVPPSTNHLFATVRGRRVKSREYKTWIEAAGWQIKAQNPKRVKGPVHISISVPKNGRRDLDNHLKPTVDLLVSLGLIESDRYATLKQIVMQWHFDPAMMVEITKL